MTAPPDPTLELYKLMVEMADRTSARRLATNTFFVTLNAGLATVVGIIGSVAGPSKASTDKTSLLMLAVVGLILASAWWGLLRYYRRLNRAKFEVINGIESNFPVKPYSDEWAKLHPASPPGSKAKRWWHNQSHREASVVEQVVPIAFGVVYLVLGVRVLAR